MPSTNVFLSRTFTIDAGHRLLDHPGKCSNFHGHTYRITVELSGEIDSTTGMVMDYAVMKTVVMPLLDNWDHGFLIARTDLKAIYALATILNNKQEPSKIFLMDGPPTAENMAAYLANTITTKVRTMGINTVKVTVSETPDTTASCILSTHE